MLKGFANGMPNKKCLENIGLDFCMFYGSHKADVAVEQFEGG